MGAPPWLWVALTLAAATAQTFRNAAQRSLTGPLGAVGATHVRFLFGLPFGLLALAAVAFLWPLPAPNAVTLGWVVVGGLSQIAATALMLAAMRERSFVVSIAYTKTEPVQVALFAVVFLGETISTAVAVAIVVVTAGVLVLSWPSKTSGEIFSWRPALLGIVSGGLYALAAVAFRGAIVALGDAQFIPAATLVLALSLGTQTVALSGWLAVRDPGTLRAIFAAWRPSLTAGVLGAFASEMWFLAIAIRDPASVRTLGLVEILIAGMISRRLFAQTPGLRDVFGMVLVIGGVALLVAGI